MKIYLKTLKFLTRGIPLKRKSVGFNRLMLTIPRKFDFSGHFHLNTPHLGQKELELNASN